MEGKGIFARLISLAAVTIVLSFVALFRLYDLQIVHGDDYYRESEKKITRTVAVPAARGEIVDRYGRKLVTNRVGYNLSLDRTLLPAGQQNEIIAELLSVCVGRRVDYTATLPISCTADRYYFSPDATTSSKTRLEQWLDRMKLDKGLSAGAIMAFMRDDYGIGEQYNAEQALEIASVRWEVDLRSPRIGLNIADYIFASDVDTDIIAVVKERGLVGVEVNTVSVREYQTDSAAHLLGRVGPIPEAQYADMKEKGYALNDRVGIDGAERAFEEHLRGVDGTQMEERNSGGKVTGVVYTAPPLPGGNVMLTLDIRLQEATEKALAARIEEIRALGEAGSSLGAADASSGAVVVMDIKNFEVLAAASYPTYPLKTFGQDYAALLADPLSPMYNRAFMGRYAPGSTFKMATAVAALESGTITTKTRIVDRGIYMFYAPNYTPMCEIYLTTRGNHGSLDLVGALRVSCNYFFYEVGRLTGIERLNYYAALLGFGQPTGIELPEVNGILAGSESREANGGRWYGGDTLQAAIGQSDNLASPLQLAAYVATLAGDGTRKNAHLLKSVKTYDYSRALYDAQVEVLSELGLSPENREAILDGMLAVSRTGSASAVFGNYPIAVGSKTGTAQVGVGSANGIFVAFAPFDNPEIAVAVVVEHAGKGSRIGNIARDVFDAYFRIGGVLDTPEIEQSLIN